MKAETIIDAAKCEKDAFIRSLKMDAWNHHTRLAAENLIIIFDQLVDIAEKYHKTGIEAMVQFSLASKITAIKEKFTDEIFDKMSLTMSQSETAKWVRDQILNELEEKP